MKTSEPEKKHLSSSIVLKLLVKNNLLSKSRAEDIQKREAFLREHIKKKREKESNESTAGLFQKDVSVIDVIVFLNINREDNGNPLDEDTIYEMLAGEWGYRYRKIDPLLLDLNLVTTTLPRSFAMRHLVLPIDMKDSTLTVATADPFNREVMDDIYRVSGMLINIVVSPKSDIIKLINEFFGFKHSISAAESQFSEPTIDLGNLEQYVKLSDGDITSNDQHVVNAVNHLFIYALDQKASDIHIEPKRNVCLVRLRIDGMLHTVYRIPKNVHSAIVSRIKNLSRLDMAEKRRPQDGRIKTDKGGMEVEVRVSIIPVAFGEKVVMRLMDPDILFQSLEKLGFSDSDLLKYQKIISMPHGIVLVCGPTGSGKSTTLYSTLRYLYSPAVNITTVEDPIEMIHEDFNQIAVQPVLGISFGAILRNILRQDPDIIMIGEMRDLETAENAIQAALTGHLVLSTLHTNDAPSSLIRLLDLGIPSFLIQATLVGVLAQRLMRKICIYCKTSFEMSVEELESMGIHTGHKGMMALSKGKGCQNCRNTGYLGRVGIFEVMPYTLTLRNLTTVNTDLVQLQETTRKEQMRSLRECAVLKMMDGLTTYQEVLRVTWEHPQ